MLRCASWEAVSSKRQALGDKMSLDRQRATNLEAIQKIGGNHVVSLVVPGESRSIKRAQGTAALQAAGECAPPPPSLIQHKH